MCMLKQNESQISHFAYGKRLVVACEISVNSKNGERNGPPRNGAIISTCDSGRPPEELQGLRYRICKKKFAENLSARPPAALPDYFEGKAKDRVIWSWCWDNHLQKSWNGS